MPKSLNVIQDVTHYWDDSRKNFRKAVATWMNKQKILLQATNSKALCKEGPHNSACYGNNAALVHGEKRQQYVLVIKLSFITYLSANPTKWLNSLKQFVGNSRRIV